MCVCGGVGAGVCCNIKESIKIVTEVRFDRVKQRRCKARLGGVKFVIRMKVENTLRVLVASLISFLVFISYFCFI